MSEKRGAKKDWRREDDGKKREESEQGEKKEELRNREEKNDVGTRKRKLEMKCDEVIGIRRVGYVGRDGR